MPRRRCLPRSVYLLLFPPRHQSPDSAVQVLSPTGKTPKSRSTEREWRILGITHVWWRICWEKTTPLAPYMSKAVSMARPNGLSAVVPVNTSKRDVRRNGRLRVEVNQKETHSSSVKHQRLLPHKDGRKEIIECKIQSLAWNNAEILGGKSLGM